MEVARQIIDSKSPRCIPEKRAVVATLLGRTDIDRLAAPKLDARLKLDVIKSRPQKEIHTPHTRGDD